MRLITVLLSVLLVGGLATPATAAPAASEPRPGWSLNGRELVWTAAEQVPIGGAAVEFWEGDRLLGHARPSPDMRTYTLAVPSITDPGKLAVRAAGRRLDVEEPLRPAGSPPAPLPEPLPAGQVDPGTPGPFQTRTGEYTLDPIKLPGYAQAVEMQAVVVTPKGGFGKRPLALFLHGRHFTCYDPADPKKTSGAWPCPAGMKPVPSHRGYLQAQRLLASQGYVTVSISANGINSQDWANLDGGAGARSELVRQHLTKWADWGVRPGSAPDIVRSGPVADLSQVLLVGHSRGGEGANRTVLDSVGARWTIRGQVLIGPTAFGQNPAPDVPSATILPGCDGDVYNLQGQMYVDATRGVSHGAALHSSLYFIGANHNYFNTEWTPGQAEAPASDDFDSPSDAVCSPGAPNRLTAVQQQNAGATYVAAAARLFVARDERALPLLDGSGARAPSADPARVLSHAVGGARTAFVVPDDATTAEGTARKCLQATQDPDAGCRHSSSPHFIRFNGFAPEPGRFAVAMQWSAAGQRATIRPGAPVSLAGSRSLALRLIAGDNTRFDVAITDTRGTRVPLGTVSVGGLPATERLFTGWAQEVRVPLPSRGIDLHRVAALELVPHGGSGQAWLIDAHGWNNGLPEPRPAALARVDVGQLTVKEGDSGTKTHLVPVRVTGGTSGTVRLFVSDRTGVTSRLVTVQPGQHDVEVPVVGNTRWSYDKQTEVSAKAVRGAVVADHTGGLEVLNDDPEPTVTVTPITDRVAEGGELKWRATLSAVADDTVYRNGKPTKPVSLPELSTTDVEAEWFRHYSFGEEPTPSRPLSATKLFAFMSIQPGELTAEITVPTIADDVQEPEEQVRLRFASSSEDSAFFEVFGTVTS